MLTVDTSIDQNGEIRRRSQERNWWAYFSSSWVRCGVTECTVRHRALEIQAGSSLEGLLSVNSDVVSQVWAAGFSIWRLEELVGVIISVGNLPWTVRGVMSHNKLCSVNRVTETIRTSNVSRSHTKNPHWTLEGKIWLLCRFKKETIELLLN